MPYSDPEKQKEWQRCFRRRDRVNNPEKYKETDRKKYLKRKELQCQKQRKWRVENPEKAMLNSSKNRAKRLGLEFNLELEDILIPINCPILGIPLKVGKGKLWDGSPTLDRIDNTLGYIKGNIAVISYKANRYKTDLDIELVERFLKYMKKEEIKKNES